MLKNLWATILEIIFPQECLQCGLAHTILCNHCLSQLPKLSPADWPTIPNINKIISVSLYPNLAPILQAYKYQGLTALAKPLAKLLADYLKTNLPNLNNAIIVPLPSHPRRVKERGFDHIGLIAAELSVLTNWPTINTILLRKKYTPHQVNLNRAERLTNLQNCFQLCSPNQLSNKNIILLDDVITTGASLQEAVQTLQTANSKTIIGLTLAYEK